MTWFPLPRVLETGQGLEECEHGLTARHCRDCNAPDNWCDICGGMPFYMGCLYSGEHYTAIEWVDWP